MKIRRPTPFTLIELLICVAVIMILVAMLMPMLSRVRYRAKLVACMNNLKQVGAGFFMYAGDNKGTFYPRRTSNKSDWNDGGYACALHLLGQNDNFDDRQYYKDYLPSPIMTCPVMPPYQDDLYTSPLNQQWAGYFLLAGWKPYYDASEKTRLRKVGDTMSYTYGGKTEKFDILTSDINYTYGWSGTDYSRTSHPDYSPSYLELQTPNTGWMARYYVLYTNVGHPLRGKVDSNYVRGDGSVFQLKGLTLKDSRLSSIPPKPMAHINSQRYMELPPVE